MCIPAALINIDRLLTLVCNQEVSPGNIYNRFTKLYIILITVISGLYLIIPRMHVTPMDVNLLGEIKLLFLNVEPTISDYLKC